MSEREQQSCMREENNNDARERRIRIMSERGLLFSSLRHDFCSALSDMIPILSQT
jgi:hypothetical protein